MELAGSRDVGTDETYDEDDVLTITVSFDADISVFDVLQFKFQVGSPIRTRARLLDCAAQGAYALVCAYTIQSEETDRDGNGISYPQNALVLLAGAAITHGDDSAVNADLTLAAMSHNCAFMVNKAGTCAQ